MDTCPAPGPGCTTNAVANGVEKWFFYKSYRDVVNVSSDGYMGISLFTEPDVGTAPNCLGETYSRRSLKNPTPVTCNADGSWNGDSP